MSSSPDPAVTPRRHAWFWWSHQSPFFTSFVHGQEETSTHRLHISGYSTVSTVYKHGEGVESKPFRAGGHRWKLTYYPNSYPGSKTGSPGVALRLMDKRRFFGRAANITAGLNVLVLDRDGNLLCGGERCLELQHSKSSSGYSGVWIDVQKTGAATVVESKDALHRLKHDTLVVRCELTMNRLEKKSRLRSLLRKGSTIDLSPCATCGFFQDI